MERVTLERLHEDAGLVEQLQARARRERAAALGDWFAQLGALLARRVYNRRSSRDIATAHQCSGKVCSTASES